MTEMNRPWGGHKVGFEYPDVSEEEKQAQQFLEGIVEAERTRKRDVKADLERIKELKFSMLEKIANLEEVKKLGPYGATCSTTSSRRAAELQVEEAKQDYPDAKDLQRFTKLAEAIVAAAASKEGIIAQKKKILHTYDKHVGSKSGWDWDRVKQQAEDAGFEYREFAEGEDGMLVGVTFGRERLTDKVGEDDVLIQHGYKDKPSDVSRRKEYVEDANGVPTRRYVTRSISHFQIATMIGLRYTPQGEIAESEEQELGHYPRGDRERFANQENTFDINNGTVGNPAPWADGRNRDHKYDISDAAERLEHTGLPSYRAHTDATRDSKMDINELSWAQVRNGSGEDQPMLSVAAIQAPVGGRPNKVVRGNKGERFDRSPETVAVIEIDLALAREHGIQFVNQHSSDSHEYKVAYDRWVQVKDEISGKDVRTDEIKRNARDELDEYIYSGRKNREVTIQHVTNDIIVRIDFEKGAERFGAEFPFAAGWMPWADGIVDVLRDFFDPDTLKQAAKDATAKKKEMGGFD